MNHEKKKSQIVQYAWQSIVNDGAKGATVRNIAKLAKMTPGQIRYYFPNHRNLLEAVASKVYRKVTLRIEGVYDNEDLSTVEKVIQGLLKVMPLDKERYADMEVWMAFQYELHETGKDSMDDEIRTLVKVSVEYLEQRGLFDESLNKYLTIVKTHALLDGLALHKLLNPKQIPDEDIIKLIENEVKSWLKGG
ncbi:TetR/AcrR family transcriptional regulator [Staphylococcus equorum]|uniref:TetR/AcrR family transcriptional regulator n=1 Tax=Staphylococcus equorum TaxID=246432 RepID=A0A9X4LBP3_9STAP|nr:TetR/AcrR family transcriptional regulator [Staphylococcus equorum]MDG0843858.1 TetR/AcrR family transcriptional regulator [Staphylococcus equorum]MDG0860149.1 TetR/AcrR family transcriptional regulator [Staphylococcus equorum]